MWQFIITLSVFLVLQLMYLVSRVIFNSHASNHPVTFSKAVILVIITPFLTIFVLGVRRGVKLFFSANEISQFMILANYKTEKEMSSKNNSNSSAKNDSKWLKIYNKQVNKKLKIA
ncbi:hypothetical protein [Weissella paramesenteroides]|uniref:hypothetical protein n=1 Tax=Weissella paramesenteroides TaxID=1249 RepID=UPI00123A2911|nr:hypothetical protein [Weissella paramesenteroides]KAA8455255.1 hypothetical protein FKV86_08125 [Weissella paramesenteroides]KAA8456284.1 hypothetical protein FKV78_08400 [Weissella paramesenteroides]KAA8458225.1 hypothetical protein FKV82_07285 [Weissella paramesenteroides]KAA8460216.1 hypothetical protein FKV80_09015 [Weissella paramesenteroides]KAA8461558.1 hypothetical protein FKV85_07995 [Weissella paramesenteroides]